MIIIFIFVTIILIVVTLVPENYMLKINNVVSHLMHRTKLCTGRWQAEEKEGKWGRVKHGEAAQCGQPIEDRGCSVMRGGTGAVRRRGG